MGNNTILTVVVCGAGTMGSGIAETSARAGFRTILYDPVREALTRSAQATARNLQQLVEKEKIRAEEKDKVLGLLQYTHEIGQCVGDLIIEAIIEKTEVKQELFRQLAALNRADTILASNTSSLSISTIAEGIPHPERVCGLHFFNPAQVMKLVEVVAAEQTAGEVLEQATRAVVAMGKTAVRCKDAPGFIVNRVARHYYLEPLRLAADAKMDMETMDEVLENAGFRMGPFKLMDLIGNDVNLAVTRSLYEACGRPERFRPSPIQEDKVQKGELGRKTGKGYYNY